MQLITVDYILPVIGISSLSHVLIKGKGDKVKYSARRVLQAAYKV